MATPVYVGISKLVYTGTDPIILDARMVKEFKRVELVQGDVVYVPTMLGRLWLKKPFFEEYVAPKTKR